MAQTLKLFWNYKIESYSNATLNSILDECDVISITEQDEPELFTMLASPKYRNQPFIGYRNGNGMHNRTQPGNATYGDGQVNLAQFFAALPDNVGTPLKHNHYLRLRGSETASGKENLIEWRDDITAADSFNMIMRVTVDGVAPVSGGNYPDNAFFDFSKQSVFDFIQNVIETWDQVYYDGNFLDNLSTQFTALTGAPYTTVIGAGDSEALREAYRDYLDRHQAFALAHVGGNLNATWEVHANIQRAAASDADLSYWKLMVVKSDGSLTRRIRGVMLELNFINYLGNVETPSRFHRYAEAMDLAVTHGVQVWSTGQLSASTISSNPGGTEGLKGAWFCAATLMFAGADTITRISNSYGTAVNYLSIMDQFEALGFPTDRYTRNGESYTRPFQGGLLTVNTNGTFSITGVTAYSARPWITHQPPRYSNADDVVSLHITARPANPDHTITFSASGLPVGLTINATTGVISGTVAASPTLGYDVILTATESDGGGASTTSFTWWTKPGTLATTDAGVVRHAYGQSANVTAIDNDGVTQVWRANNTSTTQPNSDRIVTNGNSQTTTSAVPVLDASVPPWTPVTIFQSMIFDNAAPFIEMSYEGLTDGYTYVLILLFAAYEAGRIATVTVVGADTVTETFTYDTVAGGTNNAFARTYFVQSSSGVITATVAKGTGSAGAVRLMGDELYEYSQAAGGTPTITPVADQTSTINGVAITPLQVAATAGASGQLSYAASGLPAGLTINPATGLITGTLTYTGWTLPRHDVVISVTESPGDTATDSFTWWVKPGALATKNGIAIRYQYKSTGNVAATDGDGETAAWVNDRDANTTQENTTRDISLTASFTNTTTDPARGASTPPWMDLNMLRNRVFRNAAEPSLRHVIPTTVPVVMFVTWNTDTDLTKVIDIEINGDEIESFNPYEAAGSVLDTTITQVYFGSPVSNEVVIEFNKNGITVPAYYAIEAFAIASPPVLDPLIPDEYTTNEGVSDTLFIAQATSVTSWGLARDPAAPWIDIIDNEDGTADVIYTDAVPGVYTITISATNAAGTVNDSVTLTVRDLPEVLPFELASDDSVITVLNLVEGNADVIVNGFMIDPEAYLSDHEITITPTPPSGGSFVSTQIDGNFAPDPYLIATFHPQAGDAGTYVYRFEITNTVDGAPSYRDLTINVALPAGEGQYVKRRRSRSRSR